MVQGLNPTYMPSERGEYKRFEAPTVTIDISEGETPHDQIKILFRELKRHGLDRPGLLFSGFDGEVANKQFESRLGKGKGGVFCSTKKEIIRGDDETAFEFAMDYDNPAIAIYDPTKMERPKEHTDYEYSIKEPSALLVIILLKKEL